MKNDIYNKYCLIHNNIEIKGMCVLPRMDILPHLILSHNHRVASTPELVTQSTNETIIYRRHGTRKGKIKALYGLFEGFFLSNQNQSVSKRYQAIAYCRKFENNSLEIV